MIRSLAGLIGLTLIIGMITLSIRNGLFKSPEISVGEAGPLILLWKENTGPYHKILPALQEVETWAKSKQLGCEETFGEFLDDPNSVDHDRLRSRVGCLLNTRTDERLPANVQLEERPRRAFVLASFTGSPALGPYKVYGAAADTMRAQGLQGDGPIMEIYRQSESGFVTRYLFPVKPR